MTHALNVSSEIAPLRKVVLHRPGAELLNLPPEELGRLLFDDVPFLEVAQAEHDAFADTLRGQGVEVVYLEKLVAETFDRVPGARERFCDQYMRECGLRGKMLPRVVREYLDSITDNLTFVEKTMAGVRRDEVELPISGPTTLAGCVGHIADKESELLIDPLPNLYFTRDPFAVVGHGVSINTMFSTTRNRETLYGQTIFDEHPDYVDVPRWYRRDRSYHLEGGDILNLSRSALGIGISQRTEAAAIDEFAKTVFWGADESPVDAIYAFNIPSSRAFMHLDTVFTQIDVNKFTIHPAVLGTLQVFRLTPGAKRGEIVIREMVDTLEHVLEAALDLDGVRLIACGGGDPVAAAREQWSDGSNTLAVAPGRIVVYQRNTATNEALYKEGLDLLVIPSSELSRGRGGPRCMSMPLWRGDKPSGQTN